MNTGDYAFPKSSSSEDARQWGDTYQTGMTLRDWFAGKALQGLLANPNFKGFDDMEENVANMAWKQSDWMLKRQWKEEGEE